MIIGIGGDFLRLEVVGQWPDIGWAHSACEARGCASLRRESPPVKIMFKYCILV
jgi:hypothetical protein